MRKVITILAVLIFTTIGVNAETVIKSKTALSNVKTQEDLIIDNVYLKPATKQISVRTITRYYNALNSKVDSKAGVQYHLIDIEDNKDTIEDESQTHYTDLKKEIDALLNAIAVKINSIYTT